MLGTAVRLRLLLTNCRTPVSRATSTPHDDTGSQTTLIRLHGKNVAAVPSADETSPSNRLEFWEGFCMQARNWYEIRKCAVCELLRTDDSGWSKCRWLWPSTVSDEEEPVQSNQYARNGPVEISSSWTRSADAPLELSVLLRQRRCTAIADRL